MKSGGRVEEISRGGYHLDKYCNLLAKLDVGFQPLLQEFTYLCENRKKIDIFANLGYT